MELLCEKLVNLEFLQTMSSTLISKCKFFVSKEYADKLNMIDYSVKDVLEDRYYDDVNEDKDSGMFYATSGNKGEYNRRRLRDGIQIEQIYQETQHCRIIVICASGLIYRMKTGTLMNQNVF